jgi:GAF domain-containing protein
MPYNQPFTRMCVDLDATTTVTAYDVDGRSEAMCCLGEFALQGTFAAVRRVLDQWRFQLDAAETMVAGPPAPEPYCTHCGGPFRNDDGEAHPHLTICPLYDRQPKPTPFRDVADAEYATDRVALG